MMAPSRLPFRLRIAQLTDEIRDEWNNRDDRFYYKILVTCDGYRRWRI